MKEVDKRGTKMQQRWEGPFRIVNYDKDTKGYSLECIDGKTIDMKVPIARLKVIPGETDLSEIYEVEKILNDRGKSGAKEYLVKWKYYDETSWVPATQFLADDVIREYNAGRRKSSRISEKSQKK